MQQPDREDIAAGVDELATSRLSSSRIILAVSFVILAAVVVVVLALARINLLRLTFTKIVLLGAKK
jgi:hypothetical protein